MIVKKIKNILKQYKSLKVKVILCGKFRTIVDGEIIQDIKHFQTANKWFYNQQIWLIGLITK